MTSTVINTASNETTLSTPDLLIKTKIKALDLEPIKFKLIKESGWTIGKVDKIEPLYKGFLILNALYPRDVHVPTQDIDDMWHAHILDTQKYMKDCRDFLGYYLHHFPYLGLRGEEDKFFSQSAFARTRERFLSVTGLDPVDMNAADCGGGCGSSCGSSCGTSCGGGDSGGHGGGHGGDTGGPGHGDRGGDDSISPLIGPFNESSNDSSNDTGNDRDKSRPLNDRGDRPAPQRKEPTPPPRKPFLHRILGLSETDSIWRVSVDPTGMRAAPRPGRTELLMLEKEGTPDMTRH